MIRNKEFLSRGKKYVVSHKKDSTTSIKTKTNHSAAFEPTPPPCQSLGPFGPLPDRNPPRTNATTAVSTDIGRVRASNLPLTQDETIRSHTNSTSFREGVFRTDRVPLRQRTPQAQSSPAMDVVESHRADSKETVRSKFDDVFKVSDECEMRDEC